MRAVPGSPGTMAKACRPRRRRRRPRVPRCGPVRCRLDRRGGPYTPAMSFAPARTRTIDARVCCRGRESLVSHTGPFPHVADVEHCLRSHGSRHHRSRNPAPPVPCPAQRKVHRPVRLSDVVRRIADPPASPFSAQPRAATQAHVSRQTRLPEVAIVRIARAASPVMAGSPADKPAQRFARDFPDGSAHGWNRTASAGSSSSVRHTSCTRALQYTRTINIVAFGATNVLPRRAPLETFVERDYRRLPVVTVKAR